MNFRKIRAAHRRHILLAALRLLVVAENATNRLRGLVFPDRRCSARYYLIDDRRVNPPVRPVSLLPIATSLQLGAFILSLRYPLPSALWHFGIANLLIAALAMFPATTRKCSPNTSSASSASG
ncbi:MAG: hypothetical protein CVU44_20880 [Chloroflexi bacterium HGW-Chloroflexi-6]|nr:MAG: hypothetical protein CVU44_20880 [Chloroflexi bacterium HGW-Chloroflexi-6]